ncbi:MAG: DNA-directed RNA polymerase subunit omega [bacterium]|nr:DNA-directed RNA polymerase subunit omega [Candidatus Minthenecus merdequi]
MIKKSNAPVSTITRDMNALCEPVGNIYETVRIVAKRANQIAIDSKRELDKKLAEFATNNDNLDEVFDNREQVEISRYYEQQPKPTLQAIKEFEDGEIYWKNPSDLKDEDGAD